MVQLQKIDLCEFFLIKSKIILIVMEVCLNNIYLYINKTKLIIINFFTLYNIHKRHEHKMYIIFRKKIIQARAKYRVITTKKQISVQ